MRIPTSQLAAAKVSDLRFRANEGKFPRHFKGVFRTGNMEVRILPGQPGSHSTRESGPLLAESAAFYRVFVRLSKVFGDEKTATFARICRKSPAKFPDIPVFGRLFAETDFDLH